MTNPVVGVASYGRSAASARVRLYHWLDRVQPDARVLGYTNASDNGALTLIRRPDKIALAEFRLRLLERELKSGEVETLVMSRRASPFGSGELETRLLRCAKHSVYDFDDALMARTSSLLSNQSLKCMASLRSADVVIAGNAYLAEKAAPFNNRVVTIPTCIEPSDYESKGDYAVGRVPTAIWLGSPSTESYLLHIETALLSASKATGLRLRVVSAGYRSLGRLDSIVDRLDWDPTNFRELLRTADFGIMPLPSDSWTLGKSAYKLLQYGAAGLPLVGDPVGASAEVLSVAGGFAPRGSSEWTDALISLVRASPAERSSFGTMARTSIAACYSYASWESLWRDTVGIPKNLSHDSENGSVLKLPPARNAE